MYNAQLKRLEALTARASSRASAAIVPSASNVVTTADNVAPGPLDGTTTVLTPVAAFALTPSKGGLYFVSFTVSYVLSAADSVLWLLESIAAVTAITGGATLRSTFVADFLGSRCTHLFLTDHLWDGATWVVPALAQMAKTVDRGPEVAGAPPEAPPPDSARKNDT